MSCLSRGIWAKNTHAVGTCWVSGASASCLAPGVLTLQCRVQDHGGVEGRRLRKPLMALPWRGGLSQSWGEEEEGHCLPGRCRACLVCLHRKSIGWSLLGSPPRVIKPLAAPEGTGDRYRMLLNLPALPERSLPAWDLLARGFPAPWVPRCRGMH